MGTQKQFKETILGIETHSLIFRASENKLTGDVIVIDKKIKELRKMLDRDKGYCPKASHRKIETEIALLEYQAGRKPGLLAE